MPEESIPPITTGEDPSAAPAATSVTYLAAPPTFVAIRPKGNPWLRGLAGLAGAGLLAVGLLGVLVAAYAVLEACVLPDPFAGDGFYGTVPDDWAHVARRVALAVVLVGLDVGAFAVALALLRWSGGVPWPRAGIVFGVPVAVGALVLVGTAVALFARRDQAVTPPSCKTFHLDRRAFQGSDRRQALGVVHCGVIHGQTQAQLTALLGRPDDVSPLDRSTAPNPAGIRSYDRVTYAYVQVTLRNGRAIGVRTIPPPTDWMMD